MGTAPSKPRAPSLKPSKSITSIKSHITHNSDTTSTPQPWSRQNSRAGEEGEESTSRSLSPSENGWDDDCEKRASGGGKSVVTSSENDGGGGDGDGDGGGSSSRGSGMRRSVGSNNNKKGKGKGKGKGKKKKKKGAKKIVKEVEVIRRFGGWDGDDGNQTGESRYERQIIDGYYYTARREREEEEEMGSGMGSVGEVESVEEDKEKDKERKGRKKGKRFGRKGKKGDGKEDKDRVKHPVEVGIEVCKRMGVFTVAKKDLESLPDDLLEKLPGTVTVMDLSHNKLTIIPAELCKYVLVARFSAAFNGITAVPAYFGKMTGLRKVDLSHNQIEYIPDELFRNMRQLEELDLSNNQLTTLPSSLFSAPKMLHLNVSRNRITIIPREISAMKWLMILDVVGNLIQELPESIGANTQLRKLVLDENNLSSIPSVLLSSCTELRMISLKGNPIKLANLKQTQGFDTYIDRCLNSRPKYLPRDTPGILEEFVIADP